MANGKPGPPLGSQNARKETRIVRDTLRKVAAQNPEKLRQACEALLDKAVEGDIGAFGVFRDTLDGKPNQSLEVTTPNAGNPSRDVDDQELSGIVASGSGSGTTGETDSPIKH